MSFRCRTAGNQRERDFKAVLIGRLFSGQTVFGDNMKYEDSKMEAYFNSLPEKVQDFINASGADICSLGELMMIGEHFRYSLGCDG